jgi:hypothetical protein
MEANHRDLAVKASEVVEQCSQMVAHECFGNSMVSDGAEWLRALTHFVQGQSPECFCRSLFCILLP